MILCLTQGEKSVGTGKVRRPPGAQNAPTVEGHSSRHRGVDCLERAKLQGDTQLQVSNNKRSRHDLLANSKTPAALAGSVDSPGARGDTVGPAKQLALQVISLTSAGDGVVDAVWEVRSSCTLRDRRAQSTPVELAGGVPPYRSPGRSTVSIQPLDAQLGFQVDVAGSAESVGRSSNCPNLFVRLLLGRKRMDGNFRWRKGKGEGARFVSFTPSSASRCACFQGQCDAMPRKTGQFSLLQYYMLPTAAGKRRQLSLGTVPCLLKSGFLGRASAPELSKLDNLEYHLPCLF